MPRKYEQDAVEECKTLYLRYNGQQHDKIAEQMNRRWAGFKAERVAAWAKKYQWDLLLTKKLEAELERAGWTTAQKLYRDIEHIRALLKAQVEAHGALDAEVVKLYRDYCALSINALARLEAERGGLETFIAVWEWLSKTVPEISPKAGRELVAISPEIYTRAQEFFSASKETDG